MTHDPQTPELPQRLTQDLRALGSVKAPQELWERVQLGLALGKVEQAPADLWSRVRPEIAAVVATMDSSPAGRVLHNQAWGRRMGIAAALMICAGFGFRYLGPAHVESVPALAGITSSADRAAFRAKVVFMEVSVQELSPVASDFAAAFGGLTAEDDA